MSIPEPLLTTADVAAIYQVEPKTVAEWARTGKIPSHRTPGGRSLRFQRADVAPAAHRSASTPADADSRSTIKALGQASEGAR